MKPAVANDKRVLREEDNRCFGVDLLARPRKIRKVFGRGCFEILGHKSLFAYNRIAAFVSRHW